MRTEKTVVTKSPRCKDIFNISENGYKVRFQNWFAAMMLGLVVTSKKGAVFRFKIFICLSCSCSNVEPGLLLYRKVGPRPQISL